jgi:hypothetical protein
MLPAGMSDLKVDQHHIQGWIKALVGHRDFLILAEQKFFKGLLLLF